MPRYHPDAAGFALPVGWAAPRQSKPAKTPHHPWDNQGRWVGVFTLISGALTLAIATEAGTVIHHLLAVMS